MRGLLNHATCSAALALVGIIVLAGTSSAETSMHTRSNGNASSRSVGGAVGIKLNDYGAANVALAVRAAAAAPVRPSREESPIDYGAANMALAVKAVVAAPAAAIRTSKRVAKDDAANNETAE